MVVKVLGEFCSINNIGMCRYNYCLAHNAGRLVSVQDNAAHRSDIIQPDLIFPFPVYHAFSSNHAISEINCARFTYVIIQ